MTDGAAHGARSSIVQAVCSPIRNPMPRGIRMLVSQSAKGLVRPMRWLAARTKGVPPLRYPWQLTQGPWFDNNLAVAEVHDGHLTLRWVTGDVVDGDDDRPRLRVVSEVTV